VKKALIQFISILNFNQKKKLIFLIFLSTIGSALELIGLGLLVPIIATLSNPEIVNISHINKIFDYFFFNNSQFSNNKLFFLLIFFGIFFLLKTLFLTYVSKIASKFSSNLYSDISGRIFKNYLYQEYSFYISRSSSQLIQNATNEVNNLVNVFFASFFILFSETLILFAIGLILLLLNPLTFFFALIVFNFFLIIFFSIIKNFLKKLGYARQDHQISSIRYIQEGIKNIKDLKIYGIESKFYDYFLHEAKEYSRIEQNINFLSAIPKYYIELVSILIFISIFYLLSILNVSNNDAIIIIGVLGAAALKILPSINRILNSLIKIKYSLSSASVISKEILLNKNIRNNYMIENFRINKNLILKNISFKYNNNDFLFKKINLNIPMGKIIGIIGKSGSGKTTLVDLILGLLKPSAGRILLNKKDIFKNLRSWQNNIGYVQQFCYFIEDTIKNNIALGSKENFIDDNKIYKYIKMVGLNKVVEKLSKNIETPISELGNNFSGGQKQRLSIARALYTDPQIIVLDEATNSLDDRSEEIIIKNIIKSKKNKTLIIITHKNELIKYCDVVFKVENGNVKKFK
jgi:ATP-binding cassette subfamily C protein